MIFTTVMVAFIGLIILCVIVRILVEYCNYIESKSEKMKIESAEPLMRTAAMLLMNDE